jgi:hypothetical protein
VILSPHTGAVAMRRDRTEDLADCIEKVLKDYPNQFMIDELYDTDQIRIRRKGPENFKPEDEVGTYRDSDFVEGKIDKTSIREDLQKWLRNQNKRV